jgi:opacity protein-like surface antigen
MEIRSTLNFVLEAGVGLSYFLTDNLALTAGYRFQHVSNGGTSNPKIGFESDTGTLGVSYFFPDCRPAPPPQGGRPRVGPIVGVR